MSYQSTILAQLPNALPRWWFEAIAKHYRNSRKKRTLSDWSHLVTMVYAQDSDARSLRDLERLVEREGSVVTHLGIGGLKGTTLSDAMLQRHHHPDHGEPVRLSAASHHKG